MHAPPLIADIASQAVSRVSADQPEKAPPLPLPRWQLRRLSSWDRKCRQRRFQAAECPVAGTARTRRGSRMS